MINFRFNTTQEKTDKLTRRKFLEKFSQLNERNLN